MCFRPGILLSSAARARCIANLKELPTFIEEKVATDSKETILSSVLVPICVVNEQVCLLYTLRSSKMSRHSGQVSFPGGKRDDNETDIDTALRETEEEIGFPRNGIDVWGAMNDVQGLDKRIRITPIVGQLNNFDHKNVIRSVDEVEEVFTVPMESFCDASSHAHLMYKNLPMPIFTCGKHRIWGITGLITHLFLLSFLPSDVYQPNFMRKAYKFEELLPSKL